MAKSAFDIEVEKKERMLKAFDKHAPACHNDLVHFLWNEARENTPVDTGNLRRNWSMLIRRRKGRKLTGGVYNPTEYGPHVEYGHRIMKPVYKKGNTVIYETRGYIKGKYFLRRAKKSYLKARKERLEMLQAAMDKEAGFK